MTRFAQPPATITRTPTRVMASSCADELPEIQRLWPSFEQLVGLQGRKMYAAADTLAHTYTACTPVLTDDDPVALGLEVIELAGGRYLRGRLRGQPPEIYDAIGPGFDELEALGAVDPSRPFIEFYKRFDEIELWLPVAG